MLGSWTNQNKKVSNDPRCLGHRHDQSVGSILACQLGMEHIIPHETYFQYFLNHPFNYGGENNMTGIKDSIALLCQGM
jgi:hypothetical protein